MTAVLAIAAALCLSALLQPATAVAGAFCLFGFELWAQATHPYFVTISGRSVINKIIGAIIVLGVVRKIFGGHRILRGYPTVGLCTVMLFLYALASTFWAPEPANSWSAFLKQAPYLVTIVFLCPLLCSTMADFERMLRATFVLGTVVACLLMFTVEWDGRSVKLPATVAYTANPLVTGQLGGTIAIIAAFLPWRKFKFLNILKWIVVPLGLLLAVRSGSRGQTLATIIVIFACWPIAYRLQGFKAYVALASAIIVTVAATFWGLDAYWADSERWTEDALDSAGETRLGRVNHIFDYWFTTPATIVFGLGSFAYGELIGGYSHVVPMEILSEQGIFGFLIYVGIVLSCVKNGLGSFFLVRYNPVQRTQLAILCALFMYYFLLSLKQGTMFGATPFFMAAILMGKYQETLSHHRRVQITGGDRSSADPTELG